MNYKLLILFALIASVLLSGYIGYITGVNKIPDVSEQEKNMDMNNVTIRTSFCETNGYTSSTLYAYYESWNGYTDWYETEGTPDDPSYRGGIYIRCKRNISTVDIHDYSYTDYKRWLYASSVGR